MPTRELRWTLSSDHRTGSHVTLVGEINEQTNLDRLSALPRPVRFDLSGVPYVNTMGALYLLRLIESLGGTIIGERCSTAIIRQLNLMAELADRLKVRSAVVPYECETCHTDHEVIVECGTRRPVLAPRRCGSCDGLLAPDEPVEEYFAFLPA